MQKMPHPLFIYTSESIWFCKKAFSSPEWQLKPLKLRNKSLPETVTHLKNVCKPMNSIVWMIQIFHFSSFDN